MLNTGFLMQNKLLIDVAAFALRTLCTGQTRHFQRDLAQPQIAQTQLFRKLVQDLARTAYGRKYHITGDENYETFAAKLPIQTYESMAPWIQEQIDTGQPIITPHRIIHVEPTSGSSGPVKHIPYTPQLLQSFTNMFMIWGYDQLRYGFKPETGRIFISISPPSGDSGFSDEREYLKEPLRSLVSPFLVLPPRKNHRSDFHQALALTLLQEAKLEIISIWSPSYLLILLNYIESNRSALAALLPINRRVHLLGTSIRWEAIWPNLKLISCWDNALAEPLANRLRAIFPNVQVQGKGLLATEAPITVPLLSASGQLPLVGEVFLEFEAADGKIKRLHELSEGEQVQVIITQQGGLTRYRLHDLIEVGGFYRKTPTLKFVGRTNQVCDLAGEKLNERFVCQALSPLMPSDYFLVIPYNDQQLGYLLLTTNPQSNLSTRADLALSQAYHYRLARALGQLAPLQVIHIPNLLSRILAFYQSEGMKLGNIKDTTLISNPEKGKRLLAFLNGISHRLQQPLALPEEQTPLSPPLHRPAFPFPVGA